MAAITLSARHGVMSARRFGVFDLVSAGAKVLVQESLNAIVTGADVFLGTDVLLPSVWCSLWGFAS
ncbi:MAG: hypothetical protein BJ554DRAFT_7160 [Olpidium bornovanus]|uniref:Uncharacterized protein n=1 Tax=Olpidium bornovanus TaxID=278681 RepID=A0A8H8DJE0_9FUNG|nr:MAG: hypothetical protein BJ554DRAFT_7160 [Olpidium bornovanus]